MKRAFITGVSGQDGSYLAEFLLSRRYEVHGVTRSLASVPKGLRDTLAGLHVVDLNSSEILADLILQVRPTEIYHLAAHHFSSQGEENRFGQLGSFIAVNLLAADHMLDVLSRQLREARLFYAASAQIFGSPVESPQSERTALAPDSPYAISKAGGLYLCRHYRHNHGIFAAAGILYNHESPRRGPNFVTVQIARAAALATLGRPEPLVLRDLEAVVDWGAAQDYVQAMWLTLQHATPQEYIIASGIPRTVRDFAREAFQAVGLPAEDYVQQGSRPTGSPKLPYVGDSSRIRQECLWEPEVSFQELVQSMVHAQLQALEDIGAK